MEDVLPPLLREERRQSDRDHRIVAARLDVVDEVAGAGATGTVTSARPGVLREVWGPTHTEQARYVRVYMARLRHKLEAEPARARYLLTEPGVDYRLATD